MLVKYFMSNIQDTADMAGFLAVSSRFAETRFAEIRVYG